MKEQWTVEYRDWIGRSKQGYMVRRLRKGRGKWRYRFDKVPEHVKTFLHLKPVPVRGTSNMVLSSIRSEAKLHECRVTFPARARDRFLCEIESPPHERGYRAFSPRTLAHLFHWADSPAELYRLAYKYTDCGPAIGFKLEGKAPIYCDSLRELGTWAEMTGRGERVEYLTVSSIVEGVDTETETVEVPCEPLDTLVSRWGEAIEEVNRQAKDIWNETHGCEKCGPESECGYRVINPKCRACKGRGVIL
jgi:hypothetical protein